MNSSPSERPISRDTSRPAFSGATPAALGYRMPAEWEPHAGTWLSWPHNRETWPDELEAVEQVMARAVTALAPGESVHINVLDEQHARHVRDLLDARGASGEIHLHLIPTNDAWVRDHGAIFVVRDEDTQRVAATNWGFNSWGGKYPPWHLDDAVPPQMAAALGVPCFDGDLILEGGSIDVNGSGVLLTTESCLLNPNRNPGRSRAEIEARLHDYFAVRQVCWLGDGIAGDDTNGHVDDITRFVAEDTVLTMVEPDPASPDHDPLQENLERLRELRLPHGRPLRILTLPLPAPVLIRGERMPATYANFYIGNAAVLLPVFGDPNDGAAIDLLTRCFPARRIVPIDCSVLIWGLGAFHCLTQQVPA